MSSMDEIHRFADPTLPAVYVPGYEYGFQHLYETPPHTHPESAIKLGLRRYIPNREEQPLGGTGSIGLLHHENSWELLHNALYYTHPHPNLNCQRCASMGVVCRHIDWDEPEAYYHHSNATSSAQYAAWRCLECWKVGKSCTNEGVSLSNPDGPRRIFTQDEVRARYAWKDDFMEFQGAQSRILNRELSKIVNFLGTPTPPPESATPLQNPNDSLGQVSQQLDNVDDNLTEIDDLESLGSYGTPCPIRLPVKPLVKQESTDELSIPQAIEFPPLNDGIEELPDEKKMLLDSLHAIERIAREARVLGKSIVAGFPVMMLDGESNRGKQVGKRNRRK